jgi:hypothetical protein
MSAPRSSRITPPALHPTVLTPTSLATPRKPRIMDPHHRSLGARTPITAAHFIVTRVVRADVIAPSHRAAHVQIPIPQRSD